MLHQGIQRRLAITITHEQGPDFFWKDIKELVVGKFIEIEVLGLIPSQTCSVPRARHHYSTSINAWPFKAKVYV